MDTDDLDEWLDDVPGGSPGGSTDFDRDAPERTPRRPRWVVVGVGGAVAWALLMVVVVLPARDGATTPQGDATASDDLFAVQPGVADPDTDDPGDHIAVPTPTEAPPDELLPGDPPPDDLAPDDAAIAGLGGGVQDAAAVMALRTQLTRSGDGGDTYLEFAVPIWREDLGDGVDLVVVQAIWLEGAAGQLTTVRRGRWAVPVTDDGTPLSPPWPVDAETAADPDPPPPPTGAVQLTEITRAVDDAGWADVEAIAGDRHPVLDAVLVALVRGTPPGGSTTEDAIVWLRDGVDGLQLLGARP